MTPEQRRAYKKKADEQLEKWVKGESVHNPLSPMGDKGGECCPDFSCCMPELLASEDKRRRYVAADRRGQESMLGGFLASSLRNQGHTVRTSMDPHDEDG